jgi:hypothetical protein
MKSQIGKLKYVFVIVLAVCCALISGWELLYAIPLKKCDAAGGWFSMRYRCVMPTYLPTLTGRKPGEPSKIDFHDADRKASNAEAAKAASH